MTALITSDLHLTDASRDEYRWGLFPWIREQIAKYNVDEVFVCGDLTDAKDRHSSLLVNRFVDEFSSLAKIAKVYLIRGNHDYISEQYPFFMFMRMLAGWSTENGLDFIREPTKIKTKNGNVLMLPNTKNYEEEWSGISLAACDYILCHQTFDGAKAENGQALNGIPPLFFKGFKGQVISGDVHVPQRISKNIEYVGAPYRVHFGDSFTPRVLLLRSGVASDLYFPTRSRELLECRTLRDVQRHNYPDGTQVKVRASLRRSEYPEWPKLRREIAALAKERDWDLCGGIELVALKSKDRDVEREDAVSSRSPEDALAVYADAKKLSKDVRAAGVELLKEAQ